MMFIARYNDGSCGIAEAEDETKARALLESDEADFDPEKQRIATMRPLSGRFVSRWHFERRDSDDMEIDRLGGTLGQEVADEILEHEYPLILTAHATCDRKNHYLMKMLTKIRR